jgi:hypothetical protein
MMHDVSSNEFVDLDVAFHVKTGVELGAKSDVLYIQIYLLGCASSFAKFANSALLQHDHCPWLYPILLCIVRHCNCCHYILKRRISSSQASSGIS